MHIVLVDIHVKPESVKDFIPLTLENVRSSTQEPGIARFDFLQEADDPAHFVLYEVYRQPEDQAKHRETAHYLAWKDAVAGMMAEARVGTRYTNQFPADQDW